MGRVGGTGLDFFLSCDPASASLASVVVRRTGIQALNLTNKEY